MSSIVWLSWQNAKRWRWRLVTIAALIALAFVLHVLYGGSLESSRQGNQQQSVPLATYYYDLMVIPEPGQTLIPFNQLPWTRQVTTSIMQDWDFAAAVTVNSPGGEIELLGLRERSPFFIFPKEALQGRQVAADHEMVLPQSIARRLQLGIGQTLRVSAWQGHARQSGLLYRIFTLVGIYDDTEADLATGLIRLDVALDLLGSGETNRFLVNHNRGVLTTTDTRNANSLAGMIDWLRLSYPRAQFVTPNLPQEMSRNLLSQILQPGQGILAMIVLFVAIGVLTIAIMTFLERRKEMAALKTVGIGNSQVVVMMLLEYGLAELGGLLVGATVLALLAQPIPWMRSLPPLTLLKLIGQATLSTFLAVAVALVFPLLTVRKATVTQLIYARRIPMRTRRIDHIESPDSGMVYQERTENVRLVKTPPPSEAVELFFFKQIGDPVKKGEVVAFREGWFGFYIEEWLAPCDGKVVDLGANGLLAITPTDPNEPFYPYPDHLYNVEVKRRKAMQEAAEDFRSLPQDISDEAKGLLLSDSYRAKFMREAVFMAGESGAKKVLTAKQRELRFWVGVFASVALIAFTFGMLELWFRDRQLTAAQGSYAAVRVELVTLQDVVKATSHLVPATSTEVRSATAGWVEEVLVRPGETVRQGQPLYRLSNPSLLAALDQADQDLAAARLQYDRERILSEQDNGARSEAQLKALQSENLAAAERLNQGRLQVVAKGSGVITAVNYDIGEALSRDAALFDLYDMSLESSADYQARLLQTRAILADCEAELEALTIRAKSDGVVAGLAVREGEVVSRGDLLLRFEEVTGGSEFTEAETLKIEEAEAALAAREEAVRKLQLIAPESGRLSGFMLKPGDQVTVQQSVAMLGEDQQMQTVVWVPQSRIGGVSLGDATEIHFLHSGFRREGVVAEIASVGVTQANTQAVYYGVTVEVDNPGDLLPGMRVSVDLLGSDVTAGSEGRIEGLSGTLEYRRVQTLRAVADGEVSVVNVENGAEVAKGQVLAVLSNPGLELARDQAEQELERLLGYEVRGEIAATVARLSVRPGERVVAGQELVRLSQSAVEIAYATARREYENLLQIRTPNASIRIETVGTLMELYVKEGDLVEAGQLLAELQNSDAVYRAHLAATAALKAEAEYTAQQQNPGVGSLTLADLKLEQAQLAWEARQRAVDALMLTAPHAGTIRMPRPYRQGEVVSAGTLLATVADTVNLELRTTVDEIDLLRLRHGMAVELEITAYENETFFGVVTEIAEEGVVTESGVLFPVTFRVYPEPRLRAGMTATAYVVMQEAPNVFALPLAALRRIDYGDYMVEFVDRLVDDKLMETEVATGMWTRSHVEITRGLREGDVVVVERSGLEGDGTSILVDGWLNFIDSIGKLWWQS